VLAAVDFDEPLGLHEPCRLSRSTRRTLACSWARAPPRAPCGRTDVCRTRRSPWPLRRRTSRGSARRHSPACPSAGSRGQVDELADAAEVEARTGVDLQNHAAQAGIVDLDEVHCIINELTDLWLLGPLIEVLPAGFRLTQSTPSAAYSSRDSRSSSAAWLVIPSAASSSRRTARRPSIASSTYLRRSGQGPRACTQTRPSAASPSPVPDADHVPPARRLLLPCRHPDAAEKNDEVATLI
jgi:hypothetical protein